MAYYTIRFNKKAEKEYFDAFNWYEERLKGLGHRFQTCVDNKLKSISGLPLLYPVKCYGCREIKIEDFPFLIIYKLYPKANLIAIISIFHISRKPNKKVKDCNILIHFLHICNN